MEVGILINRGRKGQGQLSWGKGRQSTGCHVAQWLRVLQSPPLPSDYLNPSSEVIPALRAWLGPMLLTSFGILNVTICISFFLLLGRVATNSEQHTLTS